MDSTDRTIFCLWIEPNRTNERILVLDALTFLSILRPSPAYEAVVMVECGRMSLIECRLICQERLNEVSGDLAESVRSSLCFAEHVGLLTVHPKACDILTYPATFACKSGQDHRRLIAEDRGARSSDCQWSYLSMTFQWSHVSHLVTWYFSSDLNPCFPKTDSEKTFEF